MLSASFLAGGVLMSEEGKEEGKKEVFPDDFYKYDESNMGRFFDNFKADIKNAYKQDFRGFAELIRKHEGMRIVHCGMGGSAISADLAKIILKDELLIESIKDYEIPGRLTNKDLVIISSYSGNTEEVISCHRQARRIGCQVIVMSSGGKLEESVGSGRIPFVKIPQGYVPRAALPYMLFSLIKVMEDLGFVKSKAKEVEELIDYLTKNSLTEIGVALSGKLQGKIPLVYAPENFYPVAYRWKTQVNENAKTACFSNAIPEMNHNEITGFVNKNSSFHAVLLSTDEDNSRMKKRVFATKNALQKAGVDVTELNFKGTSLNKVVSAVMLGDIASYYLALRYRTDPMPVRIIEGLKREMGPFI